MTILSRASHKIVIGGTAQPAITGTTECNGRRTTNRVSVAAPRRSSARTTWTKRRAGCVRPFVSVVSALPGDLDPASLGTLRLRNGDLEDAAVEPRLDLLRIHMAREAGAICEAAGSTGL